MASSATENRKLFFPRLLQLGNERLMLWAGDAFLQDPKECSEVAPQKRARI